MLRHLTSYLECTEADIRLSNILEHIESREMIEYAKATINPISRVTVKESIIETAQKLKNVNSTFLELRREYLAFKITGSHPTKWGRAPMNSAVDS